MKMGARKLILVLGGVRSGKSGFAEKLAAELGESVLYAATAEVRDEEMRQRVENHRRRRPESWSTAEVPRQLGAALRGQIGAEQVILIDCLSVLISNILLEHAESVGDDTVSASVSNQIEESVLQEIGTLLQCYRESTATFVVVSNEVGQGIVPPYPLGRLYRDLLGLANQRVAQEADEVYLLIAGIPVEIKALSREIGARRNGGGSAPLH